MPSDRPLGARGDGDGLEAGLVVADRGGRLRLAIAEHVEAAQGEAPGEGGGRAHGENGGRAAQEHLRRPRVPAKELIDDPLEQRRGQREHRNPGQERRKARVSAEEVAQTDDRIARAARRRSPCPAKGERHRGQRQAEEAEHDDHRRSHAHHPEVGTGEIPAERSDHEHGFEQREEGVVRAETPLSGGGAAKSFYRAHDVGLVSWRAVTIGAASGSSLARSSRAMRTFGSATRVAAMRRRARSSVVPLPASASAAATRAR